MLLATMLGLGTCWVGGTFERNNPMFQVSEDEEFVCVITIGYPVDKQRFIEKVKNRVMKKKAVSELYIADTTDLPTWFLSAMQAVQKTPSAKNTQKVKFIYALDIIQVSVPGDYQFDLIDLGIAKLHFGLVTGGKFELGNNATFHLD